MQSTEKEACLRVLLAVARADGVVDEEEERTLAVVADQVGLSGPSGAVLDVDAELARLRSPDARQLVVRAAHAMANVDGVCAPQELALLRKIHAAFGEAAPDLEMAEQQWASRMSDAREGLARATSTFLRAVASLGDAPGASYERLVQELDASKRAALGRALHA
jgi:tellurite resistance protein